MQNIQVNTFLISIIISMAAFFMVDIKDTLNSLRKDNLNINVAIAVNKERISFIEQKLQKISHD